MGCRNNVRSTGLYPAARSLYGAAKPPTSTLSPTCGFTVLQALAINTPDSSTLKADQLHPFSKPFFPFLKFTHMTLDLLPTLLSRTVVRINRHSILLVPITYFPHRITYLQRRQAEFKEEAVDSGHDERIPIKAHLLRDMKLNKYPTFRNNGL